MMCCEGPKRAKHATESSKDMLTFPLNINGLWEQAMSSRFQALYAFSIAARLEQRPLADIHLKVVLIKNPVYIKNNTSRLTYQSSGAYQVFHYNIIIRLIDVGGPGGVCQPFCVATHVF